MMDQKQPDQGKQPAPAHAQNRPSHMNQGTQAFRPDQQKKQDQGEEHGKQKDQPPGRKAS